MSTSEHKTKRLTDQQIAERLDAVKNFDLNTALSQAEGVLRDYELRNGMSTREMRKQVVAGDLSETHEVYNWLMADNKRRWLARLKQEGTSNR